MTTPQADWYPDPQDNTLVRYWDGAQWTDQTKPFVSAPSASSKLASTASTLFAKGRDMVQARQDMVQAREDAKAAEKEASGLMLEVESHISGKNAQIRVYPDRVEWERGRLVSGGKVAAAVFTGGLSLAATGVHSKDNAGSETLPMSAITGVSLRRQGIGKSGYTVVISAGLNQIPVVCSRDDAEKLRDAIMRARSLPNSAVVQAPVQVQPIVVQAPPTAAPSVTDQLLQLKSLLDSGVLTQDEYEAKRSALVAQCGSPGFVDT